MPNRTDTMMLQMALVGFEAQLQKIEEKIGELRPPRYRSVNKPLLGHQVLW